MNDVLSQLYVDWSKFFVSGYFLAIGPTWYYLVSHSATDAAREEVKLHATDAKELGSAHERLSELDRLGMLCGGFPMASHGLWW